MSVASVGSRPRDSVKRRQITVKNNILTEIEFCLRSGDLSALKSMAGFFTELVVSCDSYDSHQSNE